MENKKLNSFKDLNIWQKAVDLAVLTYSVTEKFPRSELYGISNQMRRAAVSVSSNIAEGFERRHKMEKLQFYNVAYGSAAELESQVEIAHKLRFLGDSDYGELIALVTGVSKMTYSLIKSLYSKSYILNPKSGFTLVELLVAIAVFAAVVVVGIGGIARVLRMERQSVQMLAANSNVSLVMERMTREIRTGKWFCHKQSQGGQEPDTVQYCGTPTVSNGFQTYNTLAFYAPSSGAYVPVIYCLANGGIERGTSTSFTSCGDLNFSKITADSVNVSHLSFVLFGNEYDDGYPPRVTISVEASPSFTDTPLPGPLIEFQTTVSARLIDT